MNKLYCQLFLADIMKCYKKERKGSHFMQLTCSHCGKEIQPDDTFCAGCGKRI